MTIQPGTRLGPYEIVASIGAGGMGEVWRANDTRLDRSVAIKVLPAEFSRDAKRLQRFEREAKAVSKLNHPNICTVHDVGVEESSKIHYLVMELIEGDSLADRLHQGSLSVREVLDYGAQIARGLEAAHRLGITHRDLKPGNIMLTRTGAKLVDFGLAKTALPASDDEMQSQLPTQQKPITREGAVVGTVQYMAPEQLDGKEADARSDIFAFGCVLYEMVSGKRPFQGSTWSNLVSSIAKDDPPELQSIDSKVPPSLSHIVSRCLEKDPDERWQSAHDLASELQWISQAGSQADVAIPVTVRRKTRDRLAWAVAAVFAAACVALLATRPKHIETLVPSFRTTIPPPSGTSLIPFDEAGLALSPDGRRLAFVATDEQTTRIWIRDLSSATAKPVPETEGAHYPFWSPDGESLGFFAEGELRRIDLRGGSSRRIASAPTGRGATWGRNGMILYAPRFHVPITMVSVEGGEPKPITKFDPETQLTHRWPVFLPDSEHFVYIVRARVEGNAQIGQLRIASIDGTGDRILLEDSTNAVYVEPGYLLWGRGENLFASRFDDETLQISGDPIPVFPEKTSFWEPKNFIPFTASNDGTIAYLPRVLLNSELVFFTRDGRRMETPGTTGQNRYSGARIAPDGMRIAHGTGTTQSDVEYWVKDLELERISRITDPSGPSPILCPRCGVEWHPDSTRVTYPCQGQGGADICIKSLVDGSSGRPLVESPNWKHTWSWLPDGSGLVFSEQNSKTQEDLVLATFGETTSTTPIVATPSSERQPAVSPDGKWLAYTSDSTGRDEIYVRGLADTSGQWQISTGGGSTARWKNNEIFYVTPEGRVMVVQVHTDPSFRAGQTTQLFRLPEPTESSFEDASPDGQRILTILPTESRSPIAFQLITNWTGLVGPDENGPN